MVADIVKTLVLQGKRVIIPNFGAFLIKDASLTPILSPGNVTFSPFLRYNDGLLENEVAQRENIHKDDANQRVVKFTDEVVTAINGAGTYRIEGLGVFHKDDKNNICFSYEDAYKPKTISNPTPIATPEPSTVASPKTILTEPVDEVKAAKVDVPFDDKNEIVDRVKPSLHQEKEHAEQVEVHVVESNETIIEGDAKPISIAHKNNIPPSKLFSKGMLVSFLLLLFGLLALNLFWSDIFGTTTDSQRPRIILDPIEQSEVATTETKTIDRNNKVQDAIDKEISSTLVKKSEDKKDASAPKKEEKKAAPSKVEKVEVQSKNTEISNSYVIVLGSFGTQENAQKRILELSRKSIKAKVVIRNKMNSVVTGNFTSYEDAQKEQTRLKTLGVEGWISRK